MIKNIFNLKGKRVLLTGGNHDIGKAVSMVEVLAGKNYKVLVESKIPVGYVGETKDCASLSLLLCSNASRYKIGQDMFVDGDIGLNV